MKENIINYIPLSVYRHLRWLNNERKIYQYNKANFSDEYAKICFRADDAKRKQLPIDDILSANAARDQYILDYLMRLLDDVVDKYKELPAASYNSCERGNQKIWVFWWSGEKTAPEIVKACIRSIRRNANGHDVIMLDQTITKITLLFLKILLISMIRGLLGMHIMQIS